MTADKLRRRGKSQTIGTFIENLEGRALLSGAEFTSAYIRDVEPLAAGSSTVVYANLLSDEAGSEASTVNFYLSTDAVAGNADDVWILSTPTLSLPGPVNVTLPLDLAAGDYQVVANADGGAGFLGSPITIISPSDLPDLKFDVRDAFFGLPSAMEAVEYHGVTANILNTGRGATGAFTSRLYLSPTPQLGGDSILIKETTLAGVNGLSFTSPSFVTVFPEMNAGVYYPIVVTDVFNGVVEADEANNTMVGTSVQVGSPMVSDPIPPETPVTETPDPIEETPPPLSPLPPIVPAPDPEPQVELPEVEPTQQQELPAEPEPLPTTAVKASLTAAAGHRVTSVLTLENNSGTRVEQKYAVSFYLSDDAQLSGDDAMVAHKTVRTRLAPGAAKSYTLKFALPVNANSGASYVIATAGASEWTAASSAPIAITGGAQLSAAVVSPALPGTLKWGDRVRVRVTNDGDMAFAGRVTINLLATDSAALAPSEFILRSAKRGLFLGPGESRIVTVWYYGSTFAPASLSAETA